MLIYICNTMIYLFGGRLQVEMPLGRLPLPSEKVMPIWITSAASALLSTVLA